MKTLDQIKDNEGRYLAPPQSWNQFSKMTTNAIPNDEGDGNDESVAIMGNYRQLFQGIRENLQIEVSRQASGDSENAWQELKVFIRVYARIDFALGRPGAFQTLSGILS
jgi:HK97 family phage major capsid protein